MIQKLHIKNLELELIIGTYPHEREKKQTILLNISMAVDFSSAAASDDLTEALDYDALAKTIRARFEDSSFLLVETLAERIFAFINEIDSVKSLYLSLHKPSAIEKSDGVSVEITSDNWH